MRQDVVSSTTYLPEKCTPSTQANASSRSAKLVAEVIHLNAQDAFSAMQGTVWMARSRWSRCRVGAQMPYVKVRGGEALQDAQPRG